MTTPNLFISGGCSYSQVPNRDQGWPVHLHELSCIRYVSHTGHGAVGNDIISRKLISKILKAEEEGHKPEDMLVGVVWSGCDRQSHYAENSKLNYHRANPIGIGAPDYNNFMIEIEKEHFQPTVFDLEDKEMCDNVNTGINHTYQHAMNPAWIRNHKNPGHYIMNPHWKDEMTTHYFERFVNPAKAVMETCEHILRTQWFLKSKGINYFFSEYDNDVFRYFGPHSHGYSSSANKNDTFNPESHLPYSRDSECIIYGENYTRHDDIRHKINPEIDYLYDAIDKDYFLPVKTLQDWVTNVSTHTHAREGDPHPSTEQHKDFTQQIILPFLLEKYNIQ
jgi:hypothetical protein